MEHCRIVLRTGGQNHSFLSLRIESGFVLQRRESYSLRSCIIPQTAGELLPPLRHISSAGNANPVISVLAMAEANPKRMIYQLRHVACCSRPITWADVMLVSVRKLGMQAEMKESHKDPMMLLVIEPKNWPKTFEAIDEYFRGPRGCKGHPLKCVYCNRLVPAAAAVDPATGVAGSSYISLDEEMIARGPIIEVDPTFCPN